MFPVLTAMVTLLMGGAGAILWQQHQRLLSSEIATQNATIGREMRVDLANQATGLAMAVQPIAANPEVKKALREGNAKVLLDSWQNVFETLRTNHRLTHFYFLDAGRICLLRIHKPDRSGDLINRFTAMEAERTGKTASGIELGPLGTFTLRVVQPVFDDATLVGYVELGKEIEEVMKARCDRTGLELAVTIHKEHLNRQSWEQGMCLLGREAHWDRLPHSAVIYSSQDHLPDAFAPIADHDSSNGYAHGETDREITDGEKQWRVATLPLEDASGKEVGCLLTMRDVTAENAAFVRWLAHMGAAGGSLLTLMLGIIYVMLRRTDAGIRAQQAELRESEEHLSATLRSIGDGVITCDAEAKVVTLNVVAESLTGWSTEEARGKPIADVLNIVHARTRAKAEIPVSRALREDRCVGLANSTALIARDGTERQIADSCAPIHDETGAVIGAVLVFRDVTEEYHRLEQLRESTQRFDQLAEQSRTITWEVDAQGLYTYISDVVEPVLGYRPDEVVGLLHCYDLHPEAERETFKQAMFSSFARKDSFQNFINAALHKDGRQVWLSTNGIALLNADGTLRGYRGSDTDITTRKAAEDHLNQMLDEQQAILDSSLVGIMFLRNRIITKVNRSMAEMLGYTPEELVGQGPERLHLSREHFVAFGEQYYWRLKEQKFVNVEYPLRHKDGHVVRCQFNGCAVSPPNLDKGAVWVIADVTDRKKTELAIRTARDAAEQETAKLSAMIAGMEEGVVFADARNVVVEVNAYLCRFVGRAREQILGMRLEDIHHGPARDHILGRIETFRTNPNSEPWILQRTIGEIEAILRMQPIYRDGQYEGVLLNVIDVSELAGARRDIEAKHRRLEETNLQLEEAIERANQMAVAAEAANLSKSEFLANMSHEIRTPMTAILGYADIVAESIGCCPTCPAHSTCANGSENRRHLTTIRRNGDHLLSVINDILDLSKIEAEKMTTEQVACSPRTIVAEVASLVRIRAGAKGLAFNTEMIGPIPETIRTDPLRLKQILINLTGNAVKFTQSGSVRLRVSMEAGADLPRMHFDVIDTGPGMTADQAEHIFRPFSQADASTTRQFGGTGLGLTISKRLAKLLGGDVILVKSRPGMGAHFRATVAVGSLDGILMIEGEANEEDVNSLREASPSPLSSKTGTDSLGGLRILLVEDGPDNQRLISHYLKKAGAVVEVADNGRIGIDKALGAWHDGQPFNVILMDMQMPEMDGYEAATQLRAAGLSGAIIALTAHAMAGDRRKCIEAGCNDYASKPIDRQRLIETIQHAAEPSAHLTSSR